MMKTKTANLWLLLSFLLGAIFIFFLFTNCGRQGPRSYDRDFDEGGWIGVYVQELDNELRKYLDINERYGVLINDVVADGPAEDAGLRNEDVIVKFDDKRIRKTTDLTRAVQRRNPGEKVEVEIVRDKKKRKMKIKIGRKTQDYYSEEFDDQSKRPKSFSFRINRGVWLGVRLAELNKDLAEYFEVDEREGVLVLSVEDESPADLAGLKAGDVLLEIEGRRVRDEEDVQDRISNREVGDEIEIKFKRKGRNESIQVELGRGTGNYYFDADKMREWRDDSHRDQLHDLRDKIRFNIENKIKQKRLRFDRHRIDLGDIEAEISSAMEKVSEELEKEMARVNEELEQLKIEIKIHDF